MKKIILIVICVIMLFTLFGCAAQMAQDMLSGDYGDYKYEESAAAPAYPEEAYTEEGYVLEEPVAEGAPGMGGMEMGIGDIPQTSRKLVYTCDFTIKTSEFQKDYNKIINSVSEVGGYIQNEYTEGTPPTSTNDYGRTSDISARVPVENYGEFTEKLSGVGTVVSKNQYTDDISDSYYDTESRIELLNEQKERYMQLLEEATEMEDIIMLNEKISECIYNIEELEGSKKSMDKQVDYATININLNETVNSEYIEGEKIPTSERAKEALSMGFTGVGEFFEGFAIVIAAIFPALLVIAAITVAIVFIVKGIKKLKNNIKSKKENK